MQQNTGYKHTAIQYPANHMVGKACSIHQAKGYAVIWILATVSIDAQCDGHRDDTNACYAEQYAMKQCIRVYQRCKNPHGNRCNNGKYNRSRMNLFSIDKKRCQHKCEG